jgi:hypothetical protein
MAGYLVNTRVGAFTCNLFHHRGVALAVMGAGFLMHMDILITGIRLSKRSPLPLQTLAKPF